MDGATLKQHLEKWKITPEALAQKTGYNLAYVLQIIRGHVPFTDSAKFKISQQYPELSIALMEKKAAE